MDKSVLDNVKETSKNVFLTIWDIIKKYKKYLLLLLIGIIIFLVIIKVLSAIGEAKGRVYLSDKIKTELGCKETNNCVYTKDTSTQNYVWYSGHIWRIVKINSDGSIKLILNESVGLSNYYNGLNNDYLESFIRLWLNEGVFATGLNEPNSFLVNHEFCYGNETIECNDIIKEKVGLLTYKEYEAAGGKDSYLNIGVPFWTITKKQNSDTNAFIVNESGDLMEVSTAELYQIRPVINLNANAQIVTTTKGTKENPYVLKGDEEIKVTTFLNTRYPGEFINFAGKVWRIAETTSDYTKLVLYGKDTKMNFGENDIYSDNKNTISEFLKKVYYNILKGALPEIDDYLEQGVFYGGKLTTGDAYTNIRISTDKYRSTNASIGILSVGEMFSGNDLGLDSNNMTWTMTPYGNEVGKLYLSDGSVDKAESSHAVRPVIYLNTDVYILKGSGDGRTRETAYKLNVK